MDSIRRELRVAWTFNAETPGLDAQAGVPT
jgi:hypothetical protein